MQKDIKQILSERILVLDGAMGTMIQRRGLTGCNDALCLTHPDVIRDIHRQYVEAGADIIETNTFNANAISLREYDLSHRVEEINRAGARLAREAAGDDHFVAGSMGPTNTSLSLADGPDFDTMAAAYTEQAAALIRGGVDLLLIETAFDTLNAKAAIVGAKRAMEQTREVPVMISATLTESGRLLSGQTLDAFVTSVMHARPLAIGLNCGFGADGMIPHLRRIKELPCLVSVHPNAGLPDEMGQYVETPERMARVMEQIAAEGLANIMGGCCGTTPEHIREIAKIACKYPARKPGELQNVLMLSGLEPLELRKGDEFMKVGERCNVAGSRKFLRLINEGNLGEALDIAAAQVAAGAKVLDINMDDGMLDAPKEMARFVRQLALDPRTASVPLMIDSSDFTVIEGALKLLQGRSLVNSISLKEGEEAFLAHARRIKELGAAVVVMAFDEKGQADTLKRRIEVCERSYRLLTEKAGFRGDEIVFDPNVLAVATGISEHDTYGRDFLDAAEWISRNLPGAMVSGGVSNLSFSFRGNNPLRRAMHRRFIELGHPRGLDMAIVNPSEKGGCVSTELLDAIDDVLLCRRPDATLRLTELASEMQPEQVKKAAKTAEKPTLDRLVVQGSTEGLESLLDEAVAREGSAMAVINGILMAGMNEVGRLFGEGKMFLPQVVRSASVMRRAVDHLTPLIEAQNHADTSGKRQPVMVLATVKGDVHDIGKNIVAVVMRCSGFRVIDLGVMTPADKIVDTAIAENADLIAVSGLITPSLAEMCAVASLMEERGLKIPLFVGGATTSDLHTAVKIAPLYSGLVVRTADAASMPPVATKLDHLKDEIRARQQALREAHARKAAQLPLEEARTRSEAVSEPSPVPQRPGRHEFSPSVAELFPLINWRAFLGEWSMNPAESNEETERLLADARAELQRMDLSVHALLDILPARRSAPEEIQIGNVTLKTPRALTPNPVTGRCPAVADFIATEGDHIGLFATSVELRNPSDDEYRSLLQQTVCHRLAEAATEWLHRLVRTDLWGLPEGTSVRPAVGYPCLPDQRLIFDIDKLLTLSRAGISLTEHGAMSPGASTCGLILAHPKARYFSV